jgi:hypothetical protein
MGLPSIFNTIDLQPQAPIRMMRSNQSWQVAVSPTLTECNDQSHCQEKTSGTEIDKSLARVLAQLK